MKFNYTAAEPSAPFFTPPPPYAAHSSINNSEPEIIAVAPPAIVQEQHYHEYQDEEEDNRWGSYPEASPMERCLGLAALFGSLGMIAMVIYFEVTPNKHHDKPEPDAGASTQSMYQSHHEKFDPTILLAITAVAILMMIGLYIRMALKKNESASGVLKFRDNEQYASPNKLRRS